MKKILIGAAASLVIATAAPAADLPARTYAKAPEVAPVYNWGGFYIGLNGGGGSAHKCWEILNDTGTPVIPSVAEGCHNATGATAGGQFGYRWQAANWVFGLEAQGNWANFKGSNLNQWAVLGSSLFNDVTRIDAFGLFTGQIGYAVNNVLVYAKGGAAVVSDKYTTTFTPFGAAFYGPLVGAALATGQTAASGTETRWGGALGAGVEYGFAPGWSVALAYDHLFMGRRNVDITNVAPFFPGGRPSIHRIGQDLDIGSVRLNYTFGGPVVARY